MWSLTFKFVFVGGDREQTPDKQISVWFAYLSVSTDNKRWGITRYTTVGCVNSICGSRESLASMVTWTYSQTTVCASEMILVLWPRYRTALSLMFSSIFNPPSCDCLSKISIYRESLPVITSIILRQKCLILGGINNQFRKCNCSSKKVLCGVLETCRIT